MPLDVTKTSTATPTSDPGKTKSNDKTKSKGGDFDESKVKRDGHGQFAKKAGPEQFHPDDDWRRNVPDAIDKVFEHDKEFRKSITNVLTDIQRETGYSNEYLKKHPKAMVAVSVEYGRRVVPLANAFLKSHPKVSVSPSGEERIETYFVAPTPDDVYGSVEYRTVNTETGKVMTPLLKHSSLDEDEALSHRAVDMAPASSSSTSASKADGGSKDKPKSKGGDFDESKVKRDGHGQFAKKASKDLTWAEANALDLEWRGKTQDVQDQIGDALKTQIDSALSETMRKYGVTNDKDLEGNETLAKQITNDFTTKVTNLANDYVKSTGVGVSPSGRQRMEFHTTPEGSVRYQIVGNVDTSASNAATDAHIRKIKKAAAQTTPSKLRFNPKADISSGRVKNLIQSALEEDGDFLAHVKERTVQDILDEMTPDQRDIVEIIIGAGTENEDLTEFPELIARWEALPGEMKNVIDYFVGIHLGEDAFLHSQQEFVDNFLAQSGVKGMRWGVHNAETAARLSKSAANTKINRLVARDAVKGGRATLGQAHVAALKSTGHRVLNGMLGDQTYWKRAAIIAGVTAAGVGLSIAAPAALPAGVLGAIGAHTVGTAGLATGHMFVGGVAVNSAAQIGAQVVGQVGMATSLAVGSAASQVNGYTNLVRAIRGNARINNSYAALGKHVQDRQTAGTDRVNKILNRNGSIAKKDLRHNEDILDNFLAQSGVLGMKWGVRKDERALNEKDMALNMSQRSQVKFASTVAALASAGMATNAAATLFQLQNRIEHYQMAKAVLDQAQNNPFIDDAGREAIRRTKNQIVQGIVGSALATTAVTLAIGIVTQRTAKAYFAPMHKVYGDSKGRINGELRTLSKDIKSGKRPHLTVEGYNKEVASIVQKHMTADKKNLVAPFHELARQQLGLDYNTKQLKIKLEKLPNTDLYDKMTITTPHGLKLVKAIKRVEHSALDDDPDEIGDIDLFFDYKFDADGFIEEWSCPTIEVADDILEGRFDMDSVAERFGRTSQLESFGHAELVGDSALVDIFLLSHGIDRKSVLQADMSLVDDFLEHHGIKGMRWGIRRPRDDSDGTVDGGAAEKGTKSSGGGGSGSDSSSTPVKAPKADTNGDGKEDHIAVDAVRFAHVREKSIHEMSNQELKDANARAQAIKNYNDIFNPSSQANSALQNKVNQLKLQKEYAQLQRELSPPSKIDKFARRAEQGFATYQAIDKTLGGQLSVGLTRKFGLVPPPSTIDLLKNEKERLGLHKDIIVAKGQLIEERKLGKHIDDAASLAPAYPYVGKHSSGGLIIPGKHNAARPSLDDYNARHLPPLPSSGKGYKLNRDGSLTPTKATTSHRGSGRPDLFKSGPMAGKHRG